VLSENFSLSGLAFKNIAQRLEGKDVDFLDLDAPYDDIFSRLRRFFKR
jgi:septum site-determining protein MinD